jgi:hypothetical protein
MVTDTRYLVVAAKVAIRKAPPRPPLSLDSGDEGENDNIDGLLKGSLREQDG